MTAGGNKGTGLGIGRSPIKEGIAVTMTGCARTWHLAEKPAGQGVTAVLAFDVGTTCGEEPRYMWRSATMP